MANEFIRILDNQIEGIKQDKLKAEQLAIEKRRDIVDLLYDYVDKVSEIIESANYLQSLGYYFWNGKLSEIKHGCIQMKAESTSFNVGIVCKNGLNSNSLDVMTGVGMFSSLDRPCKLISIEYGDVYLTEYNHGVMVSKSVAYNCDYLLGYDGVYHAESMLTKLPEFIVKYTDMINNFRHRNYKRFK